MDHGLFVHNSLQSENGHKNSTHHITLSTIWIHLQELPNECYDLKILKKIRQLIGKILKIDSCVTITTRGRYVRLCILAPLGKPILRNVMIRKHLQEINYEDTNPICTVCGCLGHNLYQCHTRNLTTTKTDEQSSTYATTGQWKTIFYAQKRYATTTLDPQKIGKENIGKEKIEKNEGKITVEKIEKKG